MVQQIYLPIEFDQLLELVKQLNVKERKQLLQFLVESGLEEDFSTLTHLASEKSLAEDWLTPIEDEAWQTL